MKQCAGKGKLEMNQVTLAMSGLSDSTIITVIIISGVFSLICMVSVASFKKWSAKLGFITAAAISQLCLIVLAVNQVVNSRRQIENLQAITDRVSNLGAPSMHPLSEKSMKVKGAIERVMHQRGFSSVSFDEDNEGLVCYFSTAGNDWADTFVFVPHYDIEKLGKKHDSVIDHDVDAYIFNEFPFAENGTRHFNECITDLHSHVTMLVRLIANQRPGWKYNEKGYVFYFEEMDREFCIESVRADKLMMSTRFTVQELIFKWLAIEGLNSYIQR